MAELDPVALRQLADRLLERLFVPDNYAARDAILTLLDRLQTAEQKQSVDAVAPTQVADARPELEALTRYRNALKFYAKEEHWMTLTDDSGAPHKLLIANGDTESTEGWAVARAALDVPVEVRGAAALGASQPASNPKALLGDTVDELEQHACPHGVIVGVCRKCASNPKA